MPIDAFHSEAYHGRISLVRLGADDLPALVAFERQANDDAWSEALLEAALRGEGYAVWGARSAEDSALWAVAILAYLPFDAELQSICVLPDARRQGLAREMLGWIMRCARTQGAEHLLLELRASNVAARKLYESVGFEVDGQRRGYYRREDGRSEDALLMSRALA
ncbi:GNAT family N-acetyltransferase [Salinicola corii]|uniref:GNAT family N-acetyltransferase n=1 Tax=Salinicola corii TaxID=2606937 RepID=A0A640WHE9_9GAMM|nr:GNAT family N-acetyltransferase [Salinicola corii]KAA0019830.1 GNAT family N-acetyltransferase [Salinicola corii]